VYDLRLWLWRPKNKSIFQSGETTAELLLSTGLHKENYEEMTPQN